ncbi:MAG TPA: hypothetical protein VMY42_07720 [Thermoguttaceae bacterium]|nr:hypothetical protein [Thermoguttaceae bacterium]
MPARAGARFPDRLQSGDLDRLTSGPVARKLRLDDQYREMQRGDVARRLQLHNQVTNIVNVTNVHPSYGTHYAGDRYYHGRISPNYTNGCFRSNYYGHRYFAGECWYPTWTPWVNWSWHYHCHTLWDPRPYWCRPVIYEPSVVWVWYQPPVWVSLPVVASGTWVDVEPVPVVGRFDLQLLAVRFVDPGHAEEKLGPRYRVWFRNNGENPITEPFDVMLFAGNDAKLTEGVPRSGVRVTSVEAGDVQSVDVRLPIEVYSLGRDSKGEPAPFETLHVLIDANREVSEKEEDNNGASISRAEILPVDPASFEVAPTQVASGGEIVLAGEGFGPEPGQLLVHLDGKELEGEILGWYDLGVRATLPNVALTAPAEAELVVVRGDGAAANPLKVTISPAGAEVP